MTDAGSTVPRRHMGRLLKQARERAGMALQAAADDLEFSRARMYRIEGGEVSLRKHDVLAMCQLYGIDEQAVDVLVALARESKARGWWHAYGDVVPDWFELFIGMEAAANRIRLYAAGLIPDLLQTREYAETVLRSWPDLDEAAVRQAVAVRLERQQLLARRRPKPPILDVIVDEGVLRRSISDIDAMQRQLAYLANISQRPGISVRVLPAAAGPHRACGPGTFVILDFPTMGHAAPEPTTVYLETLNSALYLEKPREVEPYTGVWESLDDIALDRRESDDLIAMIIKEADV